MSTLLSTIGGLDTPDLIVVIVIIALIASIAANTALLVARDTNYKWWYGLLKLVFYFSSFALSLMTAGVYSAIASVSTFLGLELNKLAQLLNIQWLYSVFRNDKGVNKQNKVSADIAGD